MFKPGERIGRRGSESEERLDERRTLPEVGTTTPKLTDMNSSADGGLVSVTGDVLLPPAGGMTSGGNPLRLSDGADRLPGRRP